MLLPILIAISLSNPAQASGLVGPFCVPSSSSLREASFQKTGIENLPLQIMKASPKIEFFHKNGKRAALCSGSFISDKGDLLTASHCLDSCRSENWSKFDCSVKLDGQPANISILLADRCLAEFWNNSATGCDKLVHTDLAILRVSQLPQNFSCLHLSLEKPSSGKVKLVGFPTKTTRSGNSNEDSDGMSQYISEGEILHSDSCTIKSLGPQVEKLYADKKYYRDLKIGDQLPIASYELDRLKNFIQISNSMMVGNSGGPLLNEQNEIIGVASYIPAFSVAKGHAFSWDTYEAIHHIDCAGAGAVEPTEKLQVALDNFGSKESAKNFRCETYLAK